MVSARRNSDPFQLITSPYNINTSYLLFPKAHPETAHTLYGLFDVSVFEGLDVNVTFDGLRGNDRFDLQRRFRVLEGDEFPHEEKSRVLFFAESTPNHPQIWISVKGEYARYETICRTKAYQGVSNTTEHTCC